MLNRPEEFDLIECNKSLLRLTVTIEPIATQTPNSDFHLFTSAHIHPTLLEVRNGGNS